MNPIDHWHDYVGEATIADAILDRLLHNAQRLLLEGEFMRKTTNNIDGLGPSRIKISLQRFINVQSVIIAGIIGHFQRNMHGAVEIMPFVADDGLASDNAFNIIVYLFNKYSDYG